MPGFHPLLGLLAVAVCISYADGASISTVLKDDITAHKLRNANLHISPLAQKEDGPLPSGLYSRNNKISNADDSQPRNLIRERNYEHKNQAAAFAKINYLKSKGKDADLTEAKPRSGEDALEAGSALRKEEPSVFFQENSRDSARREKETSRSAIGSVLALSDLEEGSEDGKSSTPHSMTTSENGEDTPTEHEDDCETEEPSTSESPEPTTSPYTLHTGRKRDTTTTTTQRAKQTSYRTRSSGSFPESDSEGVNFSDSVSMESSGRSTEIWD